MLQFAPDADPSQPGVIYAGSNIRPTVRGYGNYFIPGLADDGVTSYADTPVIMYGHQYAPTGARIIIGGYTGTTGKLHQLVTNVLTLADAYTTHWTIPAGGTKWTFTSFGEYILAASPDTGTIFQQSAINTQFTAVAGSPACRSLCTFKNFVIAANCGTYGSVTGTRDMVAWSALGDHTSWVPSAATQAGYQAIYDPLGEVYYVKPIGDAVAIYKPTGIVLMRVTGNPSGPFSFQRVAGAKGALGNVGGLVDVGDRHIFIGIDDIYVFDGATTRSLTVGRVRDYLLANFYAYSGPLTPSQIQHDPVAGEVVFVAYGLVYNYRYDKWGAYTYTSTRGGVTASRALAVCHSDVLDLNGIYRAPSLTIGAPGKFYNRLAPYEFSAPPSTLYSNMQMSVLRGANDVTSLLRHVAPRFVGSPNGVAGSPTGTSTLDYYTRKDMGGTPAAVQAGYQMDLTQHRFDLTQSAQWHDMRFTFVSTAPIDVAGMEYDLTPAGQSSTGRLSP